MFLIVLQQISAILLVIAVLLHTAKADGIAGIGGKANVYGGSNVQQDMERGLDQITIGLAIAFVLLSIVIAWK